MPCRMKLKYDLRCHTCGRALFAGDYAFIKDNQYAALAKELLLSHSQNDETAVVYCSENCLNQALGKKNGNMQGNSFGTNDDAAAAAREERLAAKEARKAEEEERNREEQEKRSGIHTKALNAIKNFEFPEEETAFSRSVISFCDEYMECFPGLCSDGDYKKAYKAKAKKVLNLLKAENPAHYEKFKKAWNDAETEMKSKLQKRLKIFYIGGGAAFAGSIIAGAIISDLSIMGGVSLGFLINVFLFFCNA